MNSFLVTDARAMVVQPHPLTIDTQCQAACESVGDPAGAKDSPKRRRVSVASPATKRRAGKLRHLPEMPLDILFEVGHV